MRVCHPGYVALAVVFANAMDVVAAAMQTVAAPEIAGGLSASVDEAAGLNVTYLAAKIVGFVVVPRSCDRRGLAAVLRASIGLLAAACVLLLWPGGGLGAAYVGRGLQGLGGAGVMVTGMTLLMTALPGSHHAWAQAAYSSTTMLGPSLFAALCGSASDLVNWRLATGLALPCAGVALLALRLGLRPQRHAYGGKLVDLLAPLRPGASASASASASAGNGNGNGSSSANVSSDGLGLLSWAAFAAAGQFVVARGTRYNGSDVPWLWPLFAVGLLAGLTFVAWQRAASNRAPWLDLRAFRYPEFRFACMTATASAYGAGASAMLLPLLMRQIFGYASADVGEAHGPSACACAVGLLFSASVTARRWFNPVSLIYVGLALFAVAMGALTVATAQMDRGYLTGILSLRGLAFGLMSVPTAVVAFSRLQGHALCHGVAAYQVVRQIGTSVATGTITWRLAETQARFGYQFRTHLSPIDPALQQRLREDAAHLVGRGVSPLLRGSAGVREAFAAMNQQVQVLSYRACAQEVLVVFLGCMLLAMLLRARLVPRAREAG